MRARGKGKGKGDPTQPQTSSCKLLLLLCPDHLYTAITTASPRKRARGDGHEAW